jgi:hypothetical protein
VTPLAAEHEEIAGMRIAPEPLLDLQRQAVHAAAHVGGATRKPDAHAGGKGDHHPSSAATTRASAARRPFPSSISMRPGTATDRTSCPGRRQRRRIRGNDYRCEAWNLMRPQQPSTPRPPPSRQQRPRDPVPPRRRSLPPRAGVALRDDPELLLLAPPLPSAGLGHLKPRNRSDLMAVHELRLQRNAHTRKAALGGGSPISRLHHASSRAPSGS